MIVLQKVILETRTSSKKQMYIYSWIAIFVSEIEFKNILSPIPLYTLWSHQIGQQDLIASS